MTTFAILKMRPAFGKEEDFIEHLSSKEDIDPNIFVRTICADGQARVFTYLLSRGAQLNGTRMLHLLHIASQGGSIEICDYLVKNGCSLYEVDDIGYIPYHHALEYGHLNLVRWYISKGVDIHTKSHHRQAIELQSSPLYIAVYACIITGKPPTNLNLIQFLLANGCDPDEKIPGRSTARRLALSMENQAVSHIFDDFRK